MRKIFGNTTTLDARVIQPGEVQPGDHYGYKVVAAVWQACNTWCAFRGPTDWDDERVLNYGDEIPYGAAQALFPTLAGLGRVYTNI